MLMLMLILMLIQMLIQILIMSVNSYYLVDCSWAVIHLVWNQCLIWNVLGWRMYQVLEVKLIINTVRKLEVLIEIKLVIKIGRKIKCIIGFIFSKKLVRFNVNYILTILQVELAIGIKWQGTMLAKKWKLFVWSARKYYVLIV